MAYHAEASNNSGFFYSSTSLDDYFDDPNNQIYQNSVNPDMAAETSSRPMNTNITAAIPPRHRRGPFSHSATIPRYTSGSLQLSQSFLSWSSESGATVRSAPPSTVASPMVPGPAARHFASPWTVPNFEYGLGTTAPQDLSFNPECFEPNIYDHDSFLTDESNAGFMSKSYRIFSSLLSESRRGLSDFQFLLLRHVWCPF